MLHYPPAYWHIDDEDLGPFRLSGKLTCLPISLVFVSNGMSSICLSGDRCPNPIPESQLFGSLMCQTLLIEYQRLQRDMSSSP
jgi:hypothetical protein